MKSDTRKVVPNIINHCYQNTPDGFLLFYNVSDFLVFFTLYCVVARRHPVRVVKLCLMPDHIHESVIASSKRELSAFVKDYSSRYSLVHNRICHSAGPVFRKHYGSVPKIGDKKQERILSTWTIIPSSENWSKGQNNTDGTLLPMPRAITHIPKNWSFAAADILSKKPSASFAGFIRQDGVFHTNCSKSFLLR